jgi:hypothetical protein
MAKETKATTNGTTVQGMTKGTFIKNGYNRYFEILSMDASQTVLAEYNGSGPTGKELHLSTAVFAALAKNKNYVSVRFFYSKLNERWMEKAEALVGVASVGGTRFLLKPAKFQF